MNDQEKLGFQNYSNFFLKQYIDKIFAKLTLNQPFFGYDRDGISRRIHQILARGFYNTYPAHVLDSFKKDITSADDVNDIKVQYDFLVFDKDRVQIKWVKFVQCFLNFSMRFMYHFLSQFISIIIPGDKVGSSYTVCRFYGFEKNLDDRYRQSFLNFLDRGNVSFFHDGPLVLGMNAPLSSLDDRITVCKRPLRWILREVKFTFGDIVEFVWNQAKTFVAFGYAVAMNPIYLLLGQDILEHTVIKYLNDRQLIRNLMITNSEMSRQLLPWISLPERSFQLHFVCYSTNNVSFMFSERIAKLNVESPKNFFIKADTVWTWTERSSKWFTAFCQIERVEIVGSILFQEKVVSKRLLDSQSRKIVVFDVTPLENGWYLENFGVEKAHFYYNSWVSMKFINDIVAVGRKLTELKIFLKPKRKYDNRHSKDYISFLDSLRDDEMTLLDFDVDLYETISDAALVITIPFTSVADIAKEMNVPCIVYDASECLEEDLDIVAGKENLLSAVAKITGHIKAQSGF